MRDHGPDRSDPLAGKPLGSLTFLLEGEARSRRWTRLGIAAAVLVHGMAFFVHWPAMAQSSAQPDEKPPIFVVQLPVFSPPEPRPEPPPEPPIRVAVPDPTPFDPEPLRTFDDQPTLDIPYDPMVVPVDTLDPPPAPEPPPPLVVEVGRDITPPRRIHFVRPAYTEPARRTLTQGPVILELVIDEQGRVADVTVLRGLPLGLTESAVDAARQWRFEPSLYGGRPVSVIYRLTVTFSLQ
jgi:periplasmic protein TonB